MQSVKVYTEVDPPKSISWVIKYQTCFLLVPSVFLQQTIMRLLNSTTYEFREFRQRASRPQYAILSHRWFAEEITFATLSASELRNENLKHCSSLRSAILVVLPDRRSWNGTG
jgi:hypothetical protein